MQVLCLMAHYAIKIPGLGSKTVLDRPLHDKLGQSVSIYSIFLSTQCYIRYFELFKNIGIGWRRNKIGAHTQRNAKHSHTFYIQSCISQKEISHVRRYPSQDVVHPCVPADLGMLITPYKLEQSHYQGELFTC